MHHRPVVLLASLAAVLWSMLPAASAQTLRPVDEKKVAQAGRAWLAKPPGSGDGALQQVDDVSPAIVGDGKQDQGWGYLIPFVPDEAFINALKQEGAIVELSVNTGKVIGPGAHADIRLSLLASALPPDRFSAFRAYNTARKAPMHDQAIGPRAAEESVSFDVTAMIGQADDLQAGRVVYFLLACDPIAKADGKGGHLEFVSDGEDRPRLSVQVEVE